MLRFDSLSKLCDDVLLRQLTEVVTRDRATTAEMLALIAEVDERKLYLPAAYPSMYAYCVQELRLSEDSAYRRITAARTARQYPRILEALAEGRLHLTAVGQLTPYLTTANANELIEAAEYKTKAGIDLLIAERFPRSEFLALVEKIAASSGRSEQLVPERVGTHGSPHGELDPERADAVALRSNVAPHAPGRFALHLTIGQRTHDKLRHAQALLSHRIPSGDVTEIIDLALDALIASQESTKLAATSRPQRKLRPTRNARHIPAHVKRAVYERDGSQCTYVSETGRRCRSRTLLEIDHVDEVARGGKATLTNLRLRCRAHNQYAAECTFGRDFMEGKRRAARRDAAKANTQDDRDVTPWLRALGFGSGEARRAAEFCEGMPEAPLERRVHAAIAYLGAQGLARRTVIARSHAAEQSALPAS